jgi:putative NADH-flavin reductase
MTRIALFGATGTLGSRILAEALARGHDVTAVMRDVTRAPSQVRNVVQADATDAGAIAAAVAGHDAVVSAIGGAREGRPRMVVDAAEALIRGLAQAQAMRLVVVGGAGSLGVSGGGRLVDQPDFPEAWKPASLAQCDALDVYRARGGDIEWTYISPADLIEPGERTGRYAVGADELIVDADGRSFITAEDFAVAVIDEVETPAHIGSRFTVASSLHELPGLPVMATP